MGSYASTAFQDYLIKGNNGEEDGTAEDLEKILQHPVTSYPDSIKNLLENEKPL